MSDAPFVTLNKAAATMGAFRAAVQLGVLDRIDRDPATVQQLAVACGVSVDATRLLLAALCALGLVEPLPDGSYCPATAGLASLHPLLEIWQHLPGAMRDGASVLQADTQAGAEELYAQVLAHLDGLFTPAAAHAARLLPPAAEIFDVGTGAATWSLALAARDPECRVTALDLPGVLAVTRRAVQSAGRAGQFRYLAGDLHTIDLPPHAYDLVIVGNVCHLFDEQTNTKMLTRLANCLHPDGTLAILDVLPQSTSLVALYELGLFLRSGQGRLHALASYHRWLTQSGLIAAEPIHLAGDFPITLIAARRTTPGGRTGRPREASDEGHHH